MQPDAQIAQSGLARDHVGRDVVGPVLQLRSKMTPDASSKLPDDLATLSPERTRQLIQELRNHQIELEMQNDELRRAQAERNTAQTRYFDFYDLTPVGYVSVSEDGLIRQANLCAASLLGVARSQLALQAFSRFIDRQDQDTYYLLRKKLSETSTSQSCTLRMRKHDGSQFFARMDGVTVPDADGAPALHLVLIDITALQQAQDELRIAAAAFESKDAIVVMDSQCHILRVNRAFTEITGYSEQDVLGKSTRLLRSKRHSDSSYDAIWFEVMALGSIRTDRWLQLKSGDDFFAKGNTTAVKNDLGQTTHYVMTFGDETLQHQQDQQRIQLEAAHRDALVREVHHRIKNNLQGIGGLLQQFANQKPEIAEQMGLVAGHLNAISVVHGLSGQQDQSKVLLCELASEIALATSRCWQMEITFDVPKNWIFRVVEENEAVSMALVLNELLVNAVKHGGKAQGHVSVTLRQGAGPEGVELRILNAGHLRNDTDRTTAHHHGLQLIESLRPRQGLCITQTQVDNQVQTLLHMTAPLIALDTPSQT